MIKINSFTEDDNDMNSNGKSLVTTSSNKLVLGIDAFFFRSCFMAVLMGISLYAAPVAAHRPANLSEPIVFFPQRPLPVSKEDAYNTPLSRDIGRVVLKNSCLRLYEPGSYPSSLLVWPGYYVFEIKKRNIIISDIYTGKQIIKLKLNDKVIVSGSWSKDAGTLVRPLAKGCKGPYWSVGGVEFAHKVNRH